ncbi:MBL fold metallo-hydrolase [Paracoccus albus]|uniref:MBL fold metallo-hydrolase n=1 Tax=Paracoccus albus TaxID=3017784 RepID=UPI0022F0D454|nr:MBL fold metallo-hydrolase [Paracoccus albus]WBU62057.1 MBL fold metallo-hydrolase [Paracoccus albus]
MMRVQALGGFDAKGPACFMVDTGRARLLLDMGKGPDAGRRPDLSGIGRVDAVLISHGHADHVGSLDLLDRIGSPPVYATAPTRALAETPALRDAQDLPIRGDIAGVSVETGLAGHAPGAVWMRVGGPGGLVYSGDYAEGTGLFPSAALPRAHTAILDCSYGVEPDHLTTQIAALMQLAVDGPCLLPAPPAGRGLEIALALLDSGRRVSICDQIRQVGKVMLSHGDWLGSTGVSDLDRLLNNAGRLEPDSPMQGIMVAAGANCGSGLSEKLGPRALSAGVPIIFTGHLSQGSPAYDWVREGRATQVRWNVHPDRATLETLLSQTAAKIVIPAFATAAHRQSLSAAFPAVSWAAQGDISW